MIETIRNTRLGNLVPHLQKLQSAKLDLVIPSRLLVMTDGEIAYTELPDDIRSDLRDREAYETLNQLLSAGGAAMQVSENAAQQICGKLRIPRRFYKYLQDEHVDLLDNNVTELLKRADKNYFVRSYFGGQGVPPVMRALLSDQFKVIDHLDVLGTTLETIQDMGVAVEIGRCNLTENNMYIEVISKDVIEHADDLLDRYRSPNRSKPDNDNRVFAGFIIANSETGRGRYKVQPRAMVAKCDNGLIFKRDALAATHLGSKMEGGIQWSADTLSTEVDLVGKQTRDAVRTFLSPEYLGRKVKELEGFTKPLENPIKAVNNICKKLEFSEERLQYVVNYFVQGGDDSSMGVVNALTYYAHQAEDADLQYEVEAESVELLPQIENMQWN